MSDWISVGEATRKYAMSRATLYRLISDGRVKRAKRAGDQRAFVSAADLEAATTFRVVDPTRPAVTTRRKQGPRRR